MRANDGAGVQDAVAAHFHEVAQHGAELFKTGFDTFFAVLHHHQSLVGLDIGGQAARAHVGAVAQNAVAHVVVVGDLDVVEENCVLQLHGVAHHAVGAHQRTAPDEGAVPDFRARADDAGGTQIGRGGHGGGFMDPDGGGNFPVALKLRAEGENQFLDPAQGLPGIFKPGEIFSRKGMGQVI